MELQIQQMLKNFEELKLADQLQYQTTQKILDSSKEIQKMLENITLTKRQRLKNIPLRNCQEVKDRGFNISKLYKIQPQLSPNAFNVWCDMETRGGGWTYLINRYDGLQNFNRNWTEYKNGFGNPAKEFWLGLEHLHQLTASEDNELLFELVDWDNKTVYAHYTGFRIGNETEGYRIKVLEGYSGDAGDSFSHHFGMKFTTKDKDQDRYRSIDVYSNLNCAHYGSGGWWYKSCEEAKLTGTYFNGKGRFTSGIHWVAFHNNDYSLKEARMMIKPRGI